VSLGVGGAGLVVGAVTGVMVFSKKAQLDKGDCVGSVCGPTERSNVDTYMTLRTVSTAGLVVGAVGVAAGVTLLLTAPKSNPTAESYVAPWLGVASAGVAGRF